MRNKLVAIVMVGACALVSGCETMPKKKPVDVTQTVTVPAKRGF